MIWSLRPASTRCIYRLRCAAHCIYRLRCASTGCAVLLTAWHQVVHEALPVMHEARNNGLVNYVGVTGLPLSVQLAACAAVRVMLCVLTDR